MNHIHVADEEPKVADPYNRNQRNVHDFLKANFPNDPKPIGPIRHGWVRVIPGNPSFKQDKYSPVDQSGCAQARVWGNHIFVGSWDTYNREPGPKDRRGQDTPGPQPTVIQNSEIPLGTQVCGQATTRQVPVHMKPDKTRLDTYGGNDPYGYQEHSDPTAIPYAYLDVLFTFADAEPARGVFKFMQPDYGVATLDPNGGPEVTITSNFYGMVRTWKESLKLGVKITTRKRERSTWGGKTYFEDEVNKSANDPMPIFLHHLRASTLPDGKEAWWARLVEFNQQACLLAADPDKSLASVMKRKDIKPVVDRLEAEDPVGWWIFRWLRDGRNKDKRCNNSLLGTMLATVGTDFDKLKAALADARDAVINSNARCWSIQWQYIEDATWNDAKENFWFDLRRDVCLSLEGAKERHQDLEARSDFTKQRNLGLAADTMGVTDAFPLLRAAIAGGKIPVGIFVQPDKSPVNREYPIWEKALARKGWSEVIFEIAADAARRSTYERDVVPYLAFLFRIEKYLDRHAPTGNKKKGWAALPRYVQSSSELEFNDEDTTGTVKRRSAFTPVADNEKHTVTVPFVAVKVYGAVTQWCYAQHYHVFEEGMTDPISGGIVVNDLEVKLNGRDDYGLCFYTLIGTDIATGYPTFLTIFERLKNKTRVHFHRVRPCRSKDGIRTAACKLVEACYQFMAGNVPATDIVAQQGDLMFLRCGNDPIKAGAKVAEPQEGRALDFESHKFLPLGDSIMSLYVSEAKTPANRLGFIYAPNGLRVEHPEHENIENLAEGWWEIRRAKSYENNPVAVWSRTID